MGCSASVPVDAAAPPGSPGSKSPGPLRSAALAASSPSKSAQPQPLDILGNPIISEGTHVYAVWEDDHWYRAVIGRYSEAANRYECIWEDETPPSWVPPDQVSVTQPADYNEQLEGVGVQGHERHHHDQSSSNNSNDASSSSSSAIAAPSSPISSHVSSFSSAWPERPAIAVGTPVLAMWTNKEYFRGKVRSYDHCKPDPYEIEWADGSDPLHLKPPFVVSRYKSDIDRNIRYLPGLRVLALFAENNEYYPGTILEFKDEADGSSSYLIEWEDGDLPCYVAESEVFLMNIQRS